MRVIFFPLLVCLAACASPERSARPPERLYFAVELKQHGLKVGAPKLLGYSERAIVVEKTTPGSAFPDYHLELRPRARGPGFQVGFALDTGRGLKSSEVSLLHGEERRLMLDDTEVTLRLLKVDSPEFRALVAPLPVTSS
ncbi:MAG: hypothetical protein K1X89_15095 [Myxococcaceae bacterium]|nr:hypothetical protein [Myxococcaceae bacterium]